MLSAPDSEWDFRAASCLKNTDHIFQGISFLLKILWLFPLSEIDTFVIYNQTAVRNQTRDSCLLRGFFLVAVWMRPLMASLLGPVASPSHQEHQHTWLLVSPILQPLSDSHIALDKWTMPMLDLPEVPRGTEILNQVNGAQHEKRGACSDTLGRSLIQDRGFPNECASRVACSESRWHQSRVAWLLIPTVWVDEAGEWCQPGQWTKSQGFQATGQMKSRPPRCNGCGQGIDTRRGCQNERGGLWREKRAPSQAAELAYNWRKGVFCCFCAFGGRAALLESEMSKP